MQENLKEDLTNFLDNKIRSTKSSASKLYENLIQKHKNKFDTENFLTINSTTFNISLFHQYLMTYENTNVEIVSNLFFAEIENTNKKPSYLKQNFPSFFKLKEEISILNDGKYGYLAIGQKADALSKEDEEISWTFKTLEEAKVFINKYDSLLDIYKEFINEVDLYAQNQKFIEISNDGIVEGYSNGAKYQEILFKSDKNLFKIAIRSESHESQSYAKLFIKDNQGWSTLKHSNPKRDFNIDISYQKEYAHDAFEKIITKFNKIAEVI